MSWRGVPHTSLKGGWRFIVCTMWLGITVLALGLSIAGIGLRATEIRQFEYPNDCANAHLSIAVSTCTATILAIELLFALGYFAIATLLVWYKSDDWVVMLLGLTLVAFGAIGPGMTHVLAKTFPIWIFPVRMLRAVGVGSCLVLFYIFPNGFFVPSWTRVLAVMWITITALWFVFPQLPLNVIDGEVFRRSSVLSYLWTFSWACTGVFAQIYRYQRTMDWLKRYQIKWTMLSLLAGFIGGAIYWSEYIVRIWLEEDSLWEARLYLLRTPLAAICFVCLPVCLLIAVSQHHLWDINLIVNRALVYSILTTCIIIIYILIVGSLSTLFQTWGNFLISLTATGIVAVLFAPLRTRVQRTVNRFRYGDRDDPYLVITGLNQKTLSRLVYTTNTSVKR